MIEIEFREGFLCGRRTIGIYHWPCVPRVGEIVHLHQGRLNDKVTSVHYIQRDGNVKIVVYVE